MTKSHHRETGEAGQSSCILEFACAFGSFRIQSRPHAHGTFELQFVRSPGEPEVLGSYRAINDAILAVLRQETGCQEWDHLGPAELPHRVHDIASWKFSESTEHQP